MKLKREFYLGDTLEISKKLIGKMLVHKTPEGITKGMIVEAESYIGPFDKAAHSYNNRKSERTKVQYKEGGYAYIYLIYGMYCCFNIVTSTKGNPECVLIRALEPIEGIELMKKRRKTDDVKKLTSGPGKLCDAMGINRGLYGCDLCGDELYLEDYRDDLEIETSKRINVQYSEEANDYPWRFTAKDNKFISVKIKKIKQ
ncbi:MAG: DNA-3-methyladenine glycosylase [Clostridia bacterium]|jgi:DNA-3-methyladenine glycosylase|nr:DNA-3-methyladenine glycosylase [Clostridia bacterium]MCI2000032.1 DNA-3-methyladenine glycosylase [Clostridia bacterium]MCI2014434.1 DNA-3-methyladenine glycosylase [Clostridia bacterium]